jgi:hypothetical protein
MLTGRGLAPAGLRIDPSSLDLGTSVVGSKVSGTVTVTNTGDVATGTLTTSLDGADFSIIDDTCAKTTLAAGASCTITVQAQPGSEGVKNGSLGISSASPALSASGTVTTKAVPPGALSITPPEQAFTAALLGTLGEEVTFTVRNTGGAPTGKLEATLSGTGSDQFRLVHNLCSGTVLPANATCALDVQFKPTARAAQSATLGVSGDPGGTATSSLSGVGLAQAALAGDATTFAFGTVDVTQASLAQTWTITNKGDVASGALSTTVDGDGGEFTVTNGCGTAPLDAGKSCTIAVVFAPTSGGMKAVTITVAGTPGGSASLMAQGTGRPPSPLMVATAGTGTGSVASLDKTIDCGTTCSASYLYGTSVTLTATADDSSDFTGWSGACTGTGPCIVAMTAAESVTASFKLKSIGLHVAVSGTGSVKTDVDGSVCSSSCDTSYDWGTTLVLTAQAGTGYGFSSWTGCPSANGATCTVNLKQATSVTATFTPLPIMVTVMVSGSGSVASGGNEISCPTGCMTTFPYGSSVTLTETPAQHYHFTGWSGQCTGTATTCTFTVGTSSISVGASFAIDTFAVNVTTTGTGTVTGGGTYNYGAQVQLSESPGNGYRFSGWGGDCSSSGMSTSCTLTVDGTKNVTATFVQQVQLTTSVGMGGGSLSLSPAPNSACVGIPNCGNYDINTSVKLTANTTGGSSIGAWSGACATVAAGTTSCTVSMTANKSAGVTFLQTLSVSPSPVNGSITGGGLNCPAGNVCSVTAAYGTSVTLGTTPAAHYHLNAFSGDCSGATCTLTMTANHTVSASFALDQYTLTVTTSGTGTVSFGSQTNCSGTCQAIFNYGDMPTVTQSAGTGYHFSGWGGACTGTGTCAPTITGTTSVTATFTQQVQLSLSTGMGGGTLVPTTPASNGPCPGGMMGCYLFDINSSVTVTATATSTGATIGAWGGACMAVTAGSTTCTIAMGTSNKSASVTFLQTLTVNPVPTHGSISGGGLSCPSASAQVCSVTAAYGTSVTLAANPVTGYHLMAWGGDGTCTGNGACAPTMTANHTVTATFAPNQYTLTVTVVGTGTVSFGSVSNCSGPTCTGTFNYGDTPTVTQSAGQNYRFTGWGGACSGTGTCMPTISGTTSVTATFTQQVTLTWSTGSGGGTLSPSPAPNAACPLTSNCGFYDINSGPVTLTATPTSSGVVGAWGNDCSSTTSGSSTCTIPSMNGNKTASVTFMQYLTVSPWPTNGSITGAGLSCSSSGGTCQVTVAYGTAPTLSANPASHYHLVSWGGDCSGSTCAPSMTANRTVSATFAIDTVTLTVTVINSTGGTVSGSGITNCGSSCSLTYNYGTKIGLGEQPANYHVFGQWGGGCSGSSSSCVFSITANTTVTAVFNQALYDAGVSSLGTVSLSGTGNNGQSVSYTCNGDVGGCPSAWGFDTGSQITVTENPNASTCTFGAGFNNWTGSFASYLSQGYPQTFYISNFATANQGINWIVGTCNINGFILQRWFYGGCFRNDQPVGYDASSVGANFTCIVG